MILLNKLYQYRNWSNLNYCHSTFNDNTNHVTSQSVATYGVFCIESKLGVCIAEEYFSHTQLVGINVLIYPSEWLYNIIMSI